MMKELWRIRATQAIRDESRRLSALFRQLERETGRIALTEGEGSFRDELRRAVIAGVSAWSAMETEGFYPAVARHPALARDQALQALIDRAFKFHHELGERLRELRSMMEAEDAALDFDFEELGHEVESHFEGDDLAILSTVDRVLGNWSAGLVGPMRAVYAAAKAKAGGRSIRTAV